MKIMRAYKVELDPNNKQRGALTAHCGATRWVYNWALARKIEAFEKREKMPTAFILAKELRQVRAEVAPWLTQYSCYVIDSNLEFVDRAFDGFFRRCKEKRPGKKGFPKFRSRKKGIGGTKFSASPNSGFKIEKARVRLPKIGWIRLKERGYVPTEGVKLRSATIKEKAGRWFISVLVEEEIPDPKPRKQKVVGVDFGIKTLAVCSDGTIFENPKAYRKQLRKLKRVQRALSRKGEAGKKANRKLSECRNYQRNKKQLARLHSHIANVRANALHQISHTLTKTKSCVVIEDLNVTGMMKNHHVAQAIADVGFYELRRQLTYKGLWRGCDVRFADRWMPSSKTCSVCSYYNPKVVLGVESWACPDCGTHHNRDLNAAYNLAKLAHQKNTGAASEINARGEGSSDSQQCASVPLSEPRTGQFLLMEGT